MLSSHGSHVVELLKEASPLVEALKEAQALPPAWAAYVPVCQLAASTLFACAFHLLATPFGQSDHATIVDGVCDPLPQGHRCCCH